MIERRVLIVDRPLDPVTPLLVLIWSTAMALIDYRKNRMSQA